MPSRRASRHASLARTTASALAALATAVLLALAAGCDGGENGSGAGGTAEDEAGGREGGGPQPDGGGDRRAGVETVATGLEVPWEIAFLPDGGALVTERPGRVRLLTADGQLRAAPVAEIGVSAVGEGGLLGLALDPDFADNRFVYLYYTAGDSMELARHVYEAGGLREDARLVDGILAGPIHDSGRIHFGPDERLYVATGDAGQPGLSQDEGSLNGKFLRLDPRQYRGEGPVDPEVVSSGHRNPQGFDWQPGSGRLIATEHGQEALDEVNEIRAGRNYGWPEAEGADHEGFTAPLTFYEQTIAPSGATFVSEPGSAWTGDYLLAGLAGEQLRRLRVRRNRVARDQPLLDGRFGRLRTVVEGPDGALYVLTSNRDGRGDPAAADDRILRLAPPDPG